MNFDLPARPPIMCLTQDHLPWSHEEQTLRLCRAGARWVQLRMKVGRPEQWIAIAKKAVGICREHGAICVVNDHVEIAVQGDADGVHLGKLDVEWPIARQQLGPKKIIGGTVNNLDDAERALKSGALNYVGVGPWRFTRNKINLAPVLGAAGVSAIVAKLGSLPGWVIGGIEVEDLLAVRLTGADGVAVSSALFRDGAIEENFRRLQSAWPMEARDDRAAAAGAGLA